MRDEVWRRRNWLRFAWERNQSWMAVAEIAAAAMPKAATVAPIGETKPRAITKGQNTITIAPITASIFAHNNREAGTGAEATRSGASSPEMVSQASPPAS